MCDFKNFQRILERKRSEKDVSYLVSGLWTKRDEVPERVGVGQMGGRVALLSVDEAREEHGVPDEEDGRVVADLARSSSEREREKGR